MVLCLQSSYSEILHNDIYDKIMTFRSTCLFFKFIYCTMIFKQPLVCFLIYLALYFIHRLKKIASLFAMFDHEYFQKQNLSLETFS